MGRSVKGLAAGALGTTHRGENAERRCAASFFARTPGFASLSGRPSTQERSGAVVSVLDS